jgi:hypothetical protein
MPASRATGHARWSRRMSDDTRRQDEPDEQPPMRVERTERDDGRYLIYYSWTGEPAAEDSSRPTAQPAEASDV